MLEQVTKREALLKKKAAESAVPDFGFYNDPQIVEILYWERRNSDYQLTLNGGGLLDQDSQLADDLSTYHMLVSWAEAKIDPKRKEDEPPPPRATRLVKFEDL